MLRCSPKCLTKDQVKKIMLKTTTADNGIKAKGKVYGSLWGAVCMDKVRKPKIQRSLLADRLPSVPLQVYNTRLSKTGTECPEFSSALLYVLIPPKNMDNHC